MRKQYKYCDEISLFVCFRFFFMACPIFITSRRGLRYYKRPPLDLDLGLDMRMSLNLFLGI